MASADAATRWPIIVVCCVWPRGKS